MGEKYFFGDLGIRNAVVGYKSTDVHEILENVVIYIWEWLGIQ